MYTYKQNKNASNKDFVFLKNWVTLIKIFFWTHNVKKILQSWFAHVWKKQNTLTVLTTEISFVEYTKDSQKCPGISLTLYYHSINTHLLNRRQSKFRKNAHTCPATFASAWNNDERSSFVFCQNSTVWLVWCFLRLLYLKITHKRPFSYLILTVNCFVRLTKSLMQICAKTCCSSFDRTSTWLQLTVPHTFSAILQSNCCSEFL